MPNFNNWNEYEWENELKKDDARINAYISDLPRFIDLPNEDELLLKRMQRNPELIPQNIDWNDTPYNSIFDSDDFEDDIFSNDDWKEREGADIFLMMQKLTHEWCEIFSTSLSKKEMADGVRILTIYGKIVARLSDIVDLNNETFIPLKIALSKRVISEINNLIGELSALAQTHESISQQLNDQLSHIQTLREKLVDLLYKTKGEQGKKDKE